MCVMQTDKFWSHTVPRGLWRLGFSNFKLSVRSYHPGVYNFTAAALLHPNIEVADLESVKALVRTSWSCARSNLQTPTTIRSPSASYACIARILGENNRGFSPSRVKTEEFLPLNQLGTDISSMQRIAIIPPNGTTQRPPRKRAKFARCGLFHWQSTQSTRGSG